jgi:hypothetical protein
MPVCKSGRNRVDRQLRVSDSGYPLVWACAPVRRLGAAPAFNYRFLPAEVGPETAEAQGSRAAYFIGAMPIHLVHAELMTFGSGSFLVTPLPATFDAGSGIGAAQLKSAPG